jgi:L-asparaginase/Glu-tRNA(Gln) amidotransferase subunit D
VLPRVLILYTGGTFGMEPGLSLPELSAASLRARLQARVPELAQLANCEIEIVLNCDGAHVGPDEWLLLARRVRQASSSCTAPIRSLIRPARSRSCCGRAGYRW